MIPQTHCTDCECLDRLVDPKTKKAIAAFGWLLESKDSPPWYWVSIECRQIELFRCEETARMFYTESIEPLRIDMLMRGVIGLNGHRRNGKNGHAKTTTP